MKIVIDCNVLIAAGLKDGTCRKVMKFVVEFCHVYISEEILFEFLKVARRNKFKKYQKDLDYFIELYAEVAEFVKPKHYAYVLPDVGDIKYLALCQEIKADYLITGNIKDFPKLKYGRTHVISPAKFLHDLT